MSNKFSGHPAAHWKDDVTIALKNFRINYPCLFNGGKELQDESGRREYRVTILIPKSDQEAYNVLLRAIEERTNKAKEHLKLDPSFKGGVRSPLYDGDSFIGTETTDGNPRREVGHYFFKARSSRFTKEDYKDGRIPKIDLATKGKERLDERYERGGGGINPYDHFYSGVYANGIFVVKFYFYKNNAGVYISPKALQSLGYGDTWFDYSNYKNPSDPLETLYGIQKEQEDGLEASNEKNTRKAGFARKPNEKR